MKFSATATYFFEKQHSFYQKGSSFGLRTQNFHGYLVLEFLKFLAVIVLVSISQFLIKGKCLSKCRYSVHKPHEMQIFSLTSVFSILASNLSLTVMGTACVY